MTTIARATHSPDVALLGDEFDFVVSIVLDAHDLRRLISSCRRQVRVKSNSSGFQEYLKIAPAAA